jgi:hypothetical protein
LDDDPRCLRTFDPLASEVAPLVTMPASDRLANVTGSNCVIDGGLIKTT